MSFQDTCNEKEKTKDKDITQKPKIKKLDIKRLAIFEPKNSNHINKSINSNIKKVGGGVNPSEKKNKAIKKDNTNMPTKERKQIILEKSSIISEENGDKVIRQYPNYQSLFMNPKNSKILLFIGDNQNVFINTLINVYSNVNYRDNYRYKVLSNNLNGELRTYNVASISDGKDIYIISFPSFNLVEEIFNNGVMKKYMDLLSKKSLTEINYLFITIEKNKFLDKKEFIFFMYFINLFFDEKLKERIIILFSSDKKNNEGDFNNKIINDIFKDTNDYFLSEENLGFNLILYLLQNTFISIIKLFMKKIIIPKKKKNGML